MNEILSFLAQYDIGPEAAYGVGAMLTAWLGWAALKVSTRLAVRAGKTAWRIVGPEKPGPLGLAILDEIAREAEPRYDETTSQLVAGLLTIYFDGASRVYCIMHASAADWSMWSSLTDKEKKVVREAATKAREKAQTTATANRRATSLALLTGGDNANETTEYRGPPADSPPPAPAWVLLPNGAMVPTSSLNRKVC